MRKRWWLFLVVAVALVVGLVASGCAKPVEEAGPAVPGVPAAEAKKEEKVQVFNWDWGYYTTGPAAGNYNQSQDFCDLMKQRTNGRMNITVYFSAILGPAMEHPVLCGAGVFPMATYCPAYLASQLTLSSFTLLPAVSPWQSLAPEKSLEEMGQIGLDWARYALMHPLAQAENAKLNIICTLVTGYFYTKDSAGIVLRNKKVEKLEDFKGLVYRVSGITTEIVKLWGCNPVETPFAENYENMQKGIIDAVTAGISTARSQKLCEVSKYLMTDITLGTQNTMASVNIDAWNSLPQDIKDIWVEVANEVGVKNYKATISQGATDRAWVLANGYSPTSIYVLDPKENERMMNAAASSYDYWIKDAATRGKPQAKDFLNASVLKYEELMGHKHLFWDPVAGKRKA